MKHELPPPAPNVMSPALESAIAGELIQRPVDGSDATFVAAERVYASMGESPFDPLNPADMLIRSFILAEAEEGARSSIAKA